MHFTCFILIFCSISAAAGENGLLLLRRTRQSFVIDVFSNSSTADNDSRSKSLSHYEIPTSVQLFDRIKFEVTRPVAQIKAQGDLIQRGGFIVIPEEGKLVFPITGFYFVYYPRQFRAYLDNVQLRSRQNGLDVIFACDGQTLNVKEWSPSLLNRRRQNDDDRAMGGIFLRSLNHSTDYLSLCAKKVIGIQKDTVIKALTNCNFSQKFAAVDDRYWSQLGYPTYETDAKDVLRTLLNFFNFETFKSANFALDARKGLRRANWCTKDRLNVSTSYECHDEKKDFMFKTVCEVLSEHTENYFYRISKLSASDWSSGFSLLLYEEVSDARRISDGRRKDKEQLLAWLIYFQYRIVYSQSKIYRI